jgi:hypothetical protein
MKNTLSILLFLLLTGCSSTCCQWRGIDYWTPEDALAVQWKEYKEQLNLVEPATERIGGSVIVVCPDQARIKEIEHVSQRGLTDVTVTWILGSWAAYCDRTVELLKKRNLFDHVDEQRVYAVDTFQAGGHYALLLYMFDPAGNQWYFLNKGSSEHSEIPLDMGLPEKDRVLPWLEAIYVLAKGFGGNRR